MTSPRSPRCYPSGALSGFPSCWFSEEQEQFSLLNFSDIWRPASPGFAVILTAKIKAVGTTASQHSQDDCVPIHDSEVALVAKGRMGEAGLIEL